MSKYQLFHSEKFMSKWLVLAMDIFICAFSFLASSIIINDFDLNYINPGIFKYHLAVVLILRITAFLYFESNSGIVRHTSIEDGQIIFKTIFFSSFELLLLHILPENKYSIYYTIPYGIIVVDFFIVLFILFFSRLLVKSFYEKMLNNFKSKQKVIIYGSGYLGRTTKEALIKDKKKNYEVLCFIDDNPSSNGLIKEGTKILSRKNAFKLYFKDESLVKDEIEVIFAIQSISSKNKKEIVDFFLKKGIKLKMVPPVKTWINGQLNISQITDIKIEDLLERDPITFNNHLVERTINNEVVLISGAAGSIGSEIARQCFSLKPKKLILIDQAESALYDLETEFKRISKNTDNIEIIAEVIDVTEKEQIKAIFAKYFPSLVFHAAAYKHVPLMEQNPYQAIKVNVFGSKIIADLSNEFKVQKFVFISTDKAVNPTNVMGASKRMAEMYIQSLNSQAETDTRFIATRFGNVLGSNGSVVPLFKKQIENGGPVTVTHPEIIRYFMTIPEACQLVLEAGAMGKGGEVFVFDMGDPVKIVDLAKNMINLSGLTPGEDIEIKFTGLRSGEKLFEELMHSDENSLPTYNPKIMIAKLTPINFQLLNNELELLVKQSVKMSNNEIVSALKKIVPEYKSENSDYSVLDTLKENSTINESNS